MTALGNLHVGDRVLVLFAVAAYPVNPPAQDQHLLFSRKAREVWKERRVLGADYAARTVRVLDYHLEPVDVPYDWVREVPA